MTLASKIKHVHPFPWSVRLYGMLALAGAITFVLALTTLHLMSSGLDWKADYVSNLANGPHGWIFGFGTFVHGWGNLALAFGLRGALRPGPARSGAVLLFSLAAVGVLLTALFPTDPTGQASTVIGQIHRTVASAAFALELAALFVFSLAFRRNHRWRRKQTVSLVLSVISAMAVTWFVIAIQLGVMPGLAERTALALLLSWELWVIFQLIRPT